MQLPSDVNVYKMGFKNQVYRDATQYIACKASIFKLNAEIALEEFGKGYTELLKSRLNKCVQEVAALEAKYHNVDIRTLLN